MIASATPLPPSTATGSPTAVRTATLAAAHHTYRFSDHTVSVSDDGQTWMERPYRFTNTVVSLAAALRDSNTLHALTFEPLPTGTKLRPVYRYAVFESRDAAQTWQAGVSDEFGGCYMVNASLQAMPGPTAPSTMLLLNTQCVDSPSDSRGFGMGVRLSTDAGRTFVWSQNGDGVQFAYARDGILRFGPTNSSASLSLSIDEGRSWQTLPLPSQLNSGGFPSTYPLLAVDASNPARVTLRERIAGGRVWSSPDSGHTWAAQ